MARPEPIAFDWSRFRRSERNYACKRYLQCLSMAARQNAKNLPCRFCSLRHSFTAPDYTPFSTGSMGEYVAS